MKKSIAIMLLVCLALSLIAMPEGEARATNYAKQGLEFVLKDDGTYGVRFPQSMKDKMLYDDVDYGWFDIIIPSTYNGIPVTEILYQGFWSVKIRTLEIPSSVTTLAKLAFNGSTLPETVVIPSSVTTIGERAFMYCKGVKYIKFESPSNLKSIGDYCFYGVDSLLFVDIPNGVTTIGNCAFIFCSNLVCVLLPKSLKLVYNTVDVDWFMKTFGL